MGHTEDPIIGVTASSLTVIIEEHQRALEALKECDREWREEHHALRRGIADALGLDEAYRGLEDTELVQHVRNALVITKIDVPRGTFVMDHATAGHSLAEVIAEKVKEADTAFGDRVYVHDPSAATGRHERWIVAQSAFSIDIDDAMCDTPAPWRAGDIIRYSDDQGPIVDGQLVMRERDEDDPQWIANIVYVHRESTPLSGAEDGEEPYEWEVGGNLYPIENDQRFTKILVIEDKPWAVDDLIEHRSSDGGLIFRARIVAPADRNLFKQGWWSVVVTEIVHQGEEVNGPVVGQQLNMFQGESGRNTRVGGADMPSPAVEDEGPDTQIIPLVFRQGDSDPGAYVKALQEVEDQANGGQVWYRRVHADCVEWVHHPDYEHAGVTWDELMASSTHGFVDVTDKVATDD